jgi:hypothetical protein
VKLIKRKVKCKGVYCLNNKARIVEKSDKTMNVYVTFNLLLYQSKLDNEETQQEIL